MRESVTELGKLVDQRPELRPLLDEHIEEYGELIPHVFMSEIMTRLVDLLATDPETVEAVMKWMNLTYERGSGDIKDVIGASGVEMIPDPGKRGAELREHLSAALWSVDPWNPNWHRSVATHASG